MLFLWQCKYKMLTADIAFDAQWNLYLWDSYLPVLGNPYDKRSSRTPACRILPGALITLSDGRLRQVEDVSPADRILTQANPNKSATAIGYPINQPVKTKLIRLSECIHPKSKAWKNSTDSNIPRRREFLLPKLAGLSYSHWAASSRS